MGEVALWLHQWSPVHARRHETDHRAQRHDGAGVARSSPAREVTHTLPGRNLEPTRDSGGRGRRKEYTGCHFRPSRRENPTIAVWTSPSACPGCRGKLLKQIAELEARVAELTRKLDETLRAGKRQAAPFRKGSPKPDPKTPGRKSGDAHGTHGHRPPPPPDHIAECHEAHLPETCPHCRGRLRRDRHGRSVPNRDSPQAVGAEVSACPTSATATRAASGSRGGIRSRPPTPWAQPPVRSAPTPRQGRHGSYAFTQSHYHGNTNGAGRLSYQNSTALLPTSTMEASPNGSGIACVSIRNTPRFGYSSR